jgi:ubiquitin C-terminal hydrolase
LRPISVPVEFHCEEFDRYYRLSAAVCAHGSATRPGHYHAVVRTESNNSYVHDDARVKAVADGDDVREVTDTIYFCLFEQL